MNIEKTQEQQMELTDPSYWKPIYEEIKKIQEHREIIRCSTGDK